jgi:hypothetical protein
MKLFSAQGPNSNNLRGWAAVSACVCWLLLGVAAVFYMLHFLHLNADFPNNSPWVDWSKYTDEGWYGDAAIRHYLTGHWYWKGDFNPAVALPVWPLIELVVFRFTGVSPAAARGLTVCVFGFTLVILYWLVNRFARSHKNDASQSIAAPLTMLFLCTSPFLFVFERMAILEPLLIALTALALLVASYLRPIPWPSGQANAESQPKRRQTLALMCALGVLLTAMVLTKTTAVFLIPAVGYMVWARADFKLWPFLRLGIPPAIIAVALWLAYFFVFVRPHYLEDYRYLFSANAYTGVGLQPLETILINAVKDGAWMGSIIYPCFFIILILALFWRPLLFHNPLVPSLLLWIGGYFAFLAYHNNLQPRYYLVVAVPITVVVAIGLDEFRRMPGRRATFIASGVVTAMVLAIVVPDAIQQIDYVLHPTYEFEAAANAIKRIVLADPNQSHLILSISGSDITLMTGLPSIDDDFGTLTLDQRVAQYHPGWYVAWNELDDDKMDALSPLYHPQRVAAFPALDDPDRNLLILYRLDPATPTEPHPRHKRPTPKQLRTNIGQQPSTTQLIH